jgi:hypothetical protein
MRQEIVMSPLSSTTGRVAVLAALAAAVPSACSGDEAAPPPSTGHQEPVKPVTAPARPLAYAVGSTIHYGDRSIDVGEEVQFLTVTDDGVAFVREPLRSQPGDKPLWFTDGSTVERIGTTSGSPARGYSVEASDTGSLLVVRPFRMGREYFVVIDTSTGQLIHRDSARFGDRDVVVLSVRDDAIYWVYPADTPCDVEGDRECLRHRWVVRYDVAADSLARVPWAQYDDDLRGRPRTFVGPDRGTPPVPGTFAVDAPFFDRMGTGLVARDYDGARELTLIEARTGEPIRLRVQSGATEATRFEFSQWLDDDHLVLFAYTGLSTEIADEGDIFVCALSTGDCRIELRGQPGTAYQLPALD